MTREDAIKEINSQAPTFLQAAKKRGYICPNCGNGSGKDGDGLVLNPKTKKYKCFKCDIGGDIIDLIGYAFNLDDFNSKLAKGVELYGITIDNSTRGTMTKAKEIINTVKKETTYEDNSEYFEKCHRNIGQTAYLTDRGLTKDTLDRFNIGYDANFTDGGKLKYPMKAVIFPTSAGTFEARNIEAKNDGFRYIKHGAASLFNGNALKEEKEKPIFVVEGIIDALSIIEAGGQAIGLGSAANYRLLIEALSTVKPATALVLALDTDETGKNTQSKISEELTKRNIPFIEPEYILEGAHDPNDRLKKDRAGLENGIKKASEEVEKIPNPKEDAKSEYLKTSAGKSVNAFLEMINKNAQRPHLSTGFRDLDEALDGGLYTGLYFIGAISSLGKTTLTLQIADNLAKQGRDVLFFSLEQSKFDLMSKSISRETYLNCVRNNWPTKRAKSNLGITDMRRYNDYSEDEIQLIGNSVIDYQKYAEHIFIHEGIGNISVDDIREKIKSHISITGNERPIVFIDYLQILKAGAGDERATDKQIVDHNVTALKQLSRDFDIPIIAVSSLNRQNYSEKINMAAFKESGAIEYGSDVLIGLQLSGAGEPNFNVDEAKEKNPREIDICILKNRNGRITTTGIPMKYYPVFNCYLDKYGVDNTDGFIPITKEMEDELPFN